MIESTVSKNNNSTCQLSATFVEVLPKFFPVSVIMESRVSSSPWVDEIWDAVGLVSQAQAKQGDISEVKQGGSKQIIYGGLKITLYADECESYYHNLMSPKPGCFIVTRGEDDEGNDTELPIPFLVTLSFDEAHAYLEGDDTVFSVPIPPELYRWAEAYILENYSAEKRKKRKRKDWRKGE